MVEAALALAAVVGAGSVALLAVTVAGVVVWRSGALQVIAAKSQAKLWQGPDGEPCSYEEALSRWGETFSGSVPTGTYKDVVN